MAILINGNGNDAIYAAQDADWFASIFGNQTAITQVGNQFAASLLDANTIGVTDGVIITQEGRRIQLDANDIDNFDIPAGGQGETNYYIIGYHLVTGDLSEQTCETFVRLMDNDTDTIPEGTFRGGDDEVYVSLYRVTQDDLVITDMELLLPTVTTMSQLNTKLTDLEGGMRGMLDIDNAQVITSTPFTTSKNGAIFGSINASTGGLLNVGNKSTNYASNEMVQVWIDGIPSGTSLSITFNQYAGYNLYFAPYKTT